MKKPLFVITLILVSMVLMACGFNLDLNVDEGSGNVQTETREVSGFDRVSLSGIGDVTLVQADQESLRIEAEDNILPHITTEVRDGTLYIGFDRKAIIPTEPIKFYLSMPEVRGLESKGVSNIHAEQINTDRLDVAISGTGNIGINQLVTDSLAVNVSGAGNFSGEGETTDLKVSLSGAGNYDGEDLRSSQAEVTITGLGRVVTWVTDALDVTISGTGGVDYYGSPEVQQQVSGLGKVTDRGDK
jgi:hypothetical protein